MLTTLLFAVYANAQETTSCKQASKFLYANQNGFVIQDNFMVYIYGTDCIQIDNNFKQWYDVRDIDGNIINLEWLEVVKRKNNLLYYAVDVSKVSKIPDVAKSLEKNDYVPFTLIQGCDSGERIDKEYYIVKDAKKACASLNK